MQRLQPDAAATDGFLLPRLEGPDLASLDIDVKGFSFEGNTVFTTTTLQSLVADAVGRRLDPSALDEVRNRVSRLYIDAGYLNSGAVIVDTTDGRPQGIVHIRVVEGRVGAVRIRGLQRLDPRYVRSRLLRDNEPLNVVTLQERFRLLLADPLFNKINSRIVPGDVPGVAVLDIDVERARPYALDVFVNNYRPPSTGSIAIGLNAVVRNLTGQGDALEATVQRTSGGVPMHLGWSVAPFAAATRAFVSYDHSVSALVEESLAAIDVKSRSSRVELGIGQTLVNTLQRHIELTLGYSRRKSETTLLGMPFSFALGEVDGVAKVNAWNFSQDWTERWVGQALAVRSTVAFATNNVDTAAAQVVAVDPAAVPSRRNVVWIGQSQYVRTAVAGSDEVHLRASAQATGQHLLPLQQFALGGIGSVRGYRENAVLRDTGWAASAEYRHPTNLGGGNVGRLTVQSFVDIGAAANIHAQWQRLASLGAGLRWQYAGLTADLVFAKRLRPLGNSTQSSNLQDRGVHFQLSYRAL